MTTKRIRYILKKESDANFQHLESLGRQEIKLESNEMCQWITQLLSNFSEFEHERLTFYDQLSLLVGSSGVFSIAPVKASNGIFDKIVALGPQNKLKFAAVQVNVFLNTQKDILEKIFGAQFNTNAFGGA